MEDRHLLASGNGNGNGNGGDPTVLDTLHPDLVNHETGGSLIKGRGACCVLRTASCALGTAYCGRARVFAVQLRFLAGTWTSCRAVPCRYVT
jgi:hypothetical protein